MTVTVARGRQRRTRTTSITPQARGYAEHRRAYDARRRQRVDPTNRQLIRLYKTVLRTDPCSYCMGHCGQMAADHIVPLLAEGAHRWDNLTAAGRPCNAAKKDKPLLIFLLERTA